MRLPVTCTKRIRSLMHNFTTNEVATNAALQLLNFSCFSCKQKDVCRNKRLVRFLLSCNFFPNGFSAAAYSKLVFYGVANDIESLDCSQIGGYDVASVHQQRRVLSCVVGVLFVCGVATVVAGDVQNVIVFEQF